jgi:hypothetical protein
VAAGEGVAGHLWLVCVDGCGSGFSARWVLL